MSAESNHRDALVQGARFGLAVALFAGCVVASVLAGEPQNSRGQADLPDVALGWDVLFHTLRAGALLGAAGTVLLIAWRGARGEWPVKFGNVEYASKEVAEVSAEAIAVLSERVDALEPHGTGARAVRPMTDDERQQDAHLRNVMDGRLERLRALAR